MRRAARTDDNQPLLVDLWRKAGLSVWITSGLGQGGVDVVLGGFGLSWLVEIKDGSKVLSRRNLTPCERKFHDNWKGAISIISNEQEAMSIIKTMRMYGDCLKLS